MRRRLDRIVIVILLLAGLLPVTIANAASATAEATINSINPTGVGASLGTITIACQDCRSRAKCTGNSFRSVSRLENEAVLDRMEALIAGQPEIFDRRRDTVEHPFGSIKQWLSNFL